MVSRKDSDGEAGRIGVYVMKHVESGDSKKESSIAGCIQVFDLRGDGSFVCYLLNRFISDQSCAVLWLGNATFSIVDNDNHVEFVIVEGLHVYHFEQNKKPEDQISSASVEQRKKPQL
ncbi:hypothetical protein E3N88_04108 [Mikania micrantha]|uniref:Uncharacterized protein n=1 Tax=Mikania micrantha TaxID=192012 RepID=A0A5N6PWA9_9ASTR|nr:hypothetical protein E3N88_04108 [Mikania micrantha]